MNQQTKRSRHENGYKKATCANCGKDFMRLNPDVVSCSAYCRDTPKNSCDRINEIIDAVSNVFGIKRKAILGDGRQQKECDARFCLYGILNMLGETKYTIQTIMDKDQGTVRNGIIKFKNFIDCYPQYAASVNRVKELIKV